jgi:hypothetical protein
LQDQVSTVTRLRAEAAVLRAVIHRNDTLGAELPTGRTRDVVEQVQLRLGQAFALLRDEAATLERHERVEANS